MTTINNIRCHIISGLALLAATEATAQPAIARDEAIEAKVESVLRNMTLDEKLGQMMEIDLRAVMVQDKNGAWVIDHQKLDSIHSNYKVGSFLNTPGPQGVTAAEWEKVMQTVQASAIRHTGIPTVFGVDENHGVTYTTDGTLMPQNINVGATFNRDIAMKAAKVTAYETRACSVPWTYSPTMDLARDARWPRCWENFGEDCLVNAEMGRAMTIGFQGSDPNHIGPYNVAVSLKHFMGYGVPVSGKDRTPAIIAPQELKEKHFAPYKACIEAGALTVMVNSGSVNYIPMHANREILTGWLKEGLDWDGMLITDWADINNLFNREHVAKDKKEALRLAINAGIDMIMDPYDCNCIALLHELVDEGKVKAERIDDAVRRILRLKARLNLFEQPLQKLKDYPMFAGKEHRQVAYDGAVESMVLLKNSGILPLGQGKRILLTGPNANSLRTLNGGWTYTWQGKDVDEILKKLQDDTATRKAKHGGPFIKPNTIYEALCNVFGKENVTLDTSLEYNNDGNYDEETLNDPTFAKAVEAAKQADVIVACIGENSYTETPGNLNDLTLSANQRNLVKTLAKTGKPIVIILNEGRPRIIADIEPLAEAVVDIMLPSNAGGDALANLLAGKENFSGKLPFSYPRHISSYTCYDYRASEVVGTMEGSYDYSADVSFQWPFGHGLSYTTFEYSNLRCDKQTFDAGDTLTISVDVKNTGTMKGKEAVLLFSTDVVASQVPEVRRLRDFQKAELEPGETKTVTFRLPASALAFVNPDGEWTLEPGDFIIQTGNLKQRIALKD